MFRRAHFARWWWRLLGLFRGALLSLVLLALAAGSAWALHFDVELRTSAGPVPGSRITTHFFGDLSITGSLPVDGQTGYKIFWGYFSDLEGGPYLTDDPGFQAFAGTFLRGEQIHFRAQGSLQRWDPGSSRWGPAPADVKLVLFGGIPLEVIIGYTQNPALWQAQYDYWAAGTRFTAQGVEGPPTAIIDDAGGSGSFHAHLDWKITAGGALPAPAGAYLVTLQLYATTLHNGAPKYLPAAPIHIVFERGISEAQLQAAIQARVSPPAPSRCSATTLSWVVGGTGCSASVDLTANGGTVTALDLLGPALGEAVFECTAGQWSGASQATCSVPLARACARRVQVWTVGAQQCSGVTEDAPSGAVQTAADSDPPALGSARFACNDSEWGAATAATCALPPPPPPCAPAVLNWAVGANVCQAAAQGTPSGGRIDLSDAVSPNLGSASFTCGAGQWSQPSQAICNPPAAPLVCSAQALSWRVAGQLCNANVAATASGESASAADTEGPLVGSAVFACGNGVWAAAQAASCSALPAAGCNAAVLPWVQSGQSCSAAVPATAAGAEAQAVDSLEPTTGSARFTCSAGRWADAQQPLCSTPPPPRPCVAQALTWEQGSQQCTALAPTGDSGRSLLLNDLDRPSLGSATFSCSNGSWSRASAAICALAVPRDCPTQQLAWAVGAQTCQATAPAATAGGTLPLQDLLGPTYGNARFTCSDGSWLPVLEPAAQCGGLSQTQPRAQPRSPWRPPAVLPWQGP